jgi:hypothetical protein
MGSVRVTADVQQPLPTGDLRVALDRIRGR